jgi:transcriptional regulator with XRE-family HTH domain
MPKITVDELLRGARKDRLFEEEYQTPKRRIQRAVSEMLFRLRKVRNLTQTELAERAGWQQPYVARIERGEAQMITGLEGLEAYANALDASTVLMFVDRKTSNVLSKVRLGESDVPVDEVRIEAEPREGVDPAVAAATAAEYATLTLEQLAHVLQESAAAMQLKMRRIKHDQRGGVKSFDLEPLDLPEAQPLTTSRG